MNRLIIALCCVVICSCQNQQEAGDTMGKHYAPENQEISEAPKTSAPPPPPDFSLKKGSKVIKNGNMKFEVGQLEQAKTRVDSILTASNGYYENELYNAYRNRNTYQLKLRIPNAKFDSLVFLLENGIGKLNSKNVSVKDVTEEYVDIKIRLENKLSYLNQYKAILTKAKTIKEILEVQEKIRRIEEEIESKKGKLKFLDDKVNFSTLDLELSELVSSEISNSPGFGLRVSNAFKNGVDGFLSFLVGLVNIWPFLILLFLFFIARKPILNRLKRK